MLSLTVRRLKAGHNLQRMNPRLAQEWHPTKNGSLTARDVMPGSRRKVWWLCQKGHVWERAIEARNAGKGCPYCRNWWVSNDNSLAAVNPELAHQWHATKNPGLSPNDVTAGTKRKVWWLCARGHVWEASIRQRNRGSGCPDCRGTALRQQLATYNLQVCQPRLARQWHPIRNGTLTPRDVTMGSQRRVWWSCRRKHSWLARIASRVEGRGCPYCAGRYATHINSLATQRPDLVAAWEPVKNGDLTPEDVTWMSGKKVWWRCQKGHRWQASIYNRSRGTGCRKCLPKHLRALPFMNWQKTHRKKKT